MLFYLCHLKINWAKRLIQYVGENDIENIWLTQNHLPAARVAVRSSKGIQENVRMESFVVSKTCHHLTRSRLQCIFFLMKEICQGAVPGPEGNWGEGRSPAPELTRDKTLSFSLQPRGSLCFGGICSTAQALKIGSFLLFFWLYFKERLCRGWGNNCSCTGKASN